MTPCQTDPLQTWTNLPFRGRRAVGWCIPGRIHSLCCGPVPVFVLGLIAVRYGAGSGFGVARHYLPGKVAWTVAFTHGIPEIIVAVIISLAVLLGWKRVQRPEARARV